MDLLKLVKSVKLGSRTLGMLLHIHPRRYLCALPPLPSSPGTLARTILFSCYITLHSIRIQATSFSSAFLLLCSFPEQPRNNVKCQKVTVALRTEEYLQLERGRNWRKSYRCLLSSHPVFYPLPQTVSPQNHHHTHLPHTQNTHLCIPMHNTNYISRAFRTGFK